MDEKGFYSTAYVQTFTLTSGHSNTVNCVSFSPDNSYLASGGDDNALIIWNVANSALVFRLLFKSPVDCVLWHPGLSHTILVGCQSGNLFQIRGFSLTRNEKYEICLGIRSAIHCLDYDTTTKYLSIGMGQEVHITHEHIPNNYSGDIKFPSPPVLEYNASNVDQSLRAVAVKFHNNGKYLLVSYLAHGIVCWDVRTRTQIWTITPPRDTPNIGSSALSPNGKILTVYNMFDGLQSYSVGSFKKQSPRRHYKLDAVPRNKHKLQVAYLHQGQALVCGTTTGNVCIWETANGEYFQLLAHNDDTIKAIDTCQRGNSSYIATASSLKGQGSYIKIWRAKISRAHSDGDIGDMVVGALHAVTRQNSFRRGVVIFAILTLLIMIIWSLHVAGVTVS